MLLMMCFSRNFAWEFVNLWRCSDLLGLSLQLAVQKLVEEKMNVN